MVNLGIIGCGHVALHTYLPALVPLVGKAPVVACCDPQRGRAEQAAALFPGARIYTEYGDLLRHEGLDAILNLTPVPFHREITAAALDAGLHIYSEKPLADSVEDARALIAKAKERDRLLLCAPAVMATDRFRWLREVLAAGRIGRPTLATGQIAGMGPAAWRAYIGDPAVFYGPGVGPLIDQGVYILHGITGLLGPARRVQAFGGIAIPKRTMLVGPRAGQTVDMAINDHMLLHLDFGANTFAQILSSYAVARSKAPEMEVHGADGSISITDWYNAKGRVDIFLRDDTPLGMEGWMPGVAPPSTGGTNSLIATGGTHFVACLADGAEPLLTAEHACHVLEIILKANQSAREGRALDLETRF